MSNYKTTSSEVKHDQESENRVFPVHINQEVSREVEDGNITVVEAYLLGIIDSLVRCRDIGCYATNADIGRRMGGKSASHIGDMISDLVKRKYIVERGWTVVSNQRRRVIETFYYKAQRKSKSIYGSINRTVTIKKDEETGRFQGSKKRVIRKNPEGGIPGESREPFPEKAGNPIPGESRDIDKTYYLDKTKEGKKTSEHPAARSCSSSNSSSFPDSKQTSKQQERQDSSSIEQKTVKAIATKEVEESKYTDEFEERAFKFYRRLQKQGWACHSYNRTTWRKALLDISKHPQGKYWKRILRIYERFGYKEGREKWNLPQICSTLQFRDRYDWLCESIVDRIDDIENTLSEEEV